METTLTDELIFKKSNARVKFIAQKALKDADGNDIVKTYETKADMMRHLAHIEGEKKAAELSAHDATNEAERAKYDADRVKNIIIEAGKAFGADVDTILAASQVAADVATNTKNTANVDYYNAVRTNSNIDVANANIQAIITYCNALRDALLIVLDHAVFYDVEGIQFSEILDKYMELAKQTRVTTITDGGSIPTRWAFPLF